LSPRSVAERSDRSATRTEDYRCPLCGGASEHEFDATDRNRRITSEVFRYRRCESCGTIFMVAVPAELGRYYAGDYYRLDEGGEPAWRSDPGQLKAEAWRVEMLRSLVLPGPLVDVGAGAGGFASAAQQAGFEVTAIEMDPACCEYMNTRLGVNAICTADPMQTIEALPRARVVTLWHVLEHLRQPGEMLAAAAGALEPGGILAVAVPNPESLQFRLLRSRWAHLDAPRHLCLLPASAIATKALDLGLQYVASTTSDPSGLLCNVHGWVYALRRDPSAGFAKGLPLRVGARFTSVVAPLEHRGNRGAAFTMFLRKHEV
jgi:SAM-dependent methyltransferase